MITDNLHDFLLASVGASASFIGLLFVALTLVIGRMPAGTPFVGRERALANSAYTALVIIFFLSMVGLIPDANVAWIMVALGWFGALSSLQLARASQHDADRERTGVVSTLTIIYATLAIFGLHTALSQTQHINPDIMFGILLILYITALNRAWALVGAELPHPDRPVRQPRKKLSD